MKKVTLFTAILLLNCFALIYASGIDGSWKGKMNTPNGDLNLVFSFKVFGDSLSGSVKSDMGELPISMGKIKGDNISFVVKVGENSITHEGVVKGDTLKLTTKEFPGDIVLTRVVEVSKLDGKWLTKTQGPNGELNIVFTFKVQGDSLSGSNKSEMGEFPIVASKLNGDNFSFDIDFNGMKISHDCKMISPDTIRAKVNVMDQEQEFTLTRIKE